MRNFAGSQFFSIGLEADGASNPVCFTVWDFGKAAGFATVVRLGEVACFGDLSGFDEKTSDSQLASLVSIGRNANAAIAAMTVRGRTPKPDPTIFLPGSNRYFPDIDFLCGFDDSMAAPGAF